MSEISGLRILCLDGGDARVMSQLYILQEMMHRVEFKTGKKTLPCQYFDLIIAVDRSSLIAVLLGLLQMTVEEAQEAFHDIYSKVFDTELSPEERGSVLETTIKELLKARNISDTAKLSDDVFTGTCKMAICYSPAANLNECKMFRNYKSPQVVTQDATIIEAVRASCATPSVISSIGVGPVGREEKVLSAMHGFNNPVPAAIKETYHVFGPETRISCFLSLGSGHRGVISSELGLVPEAQLAMSGERVAEDLNERLGELDVYHRFSVERGLEGYSTYSGEPGSIKSHVDAYLSNKEHSLRLDHCLGATDISVDVKIEQLYGIRPGGTSSMHGLPPLSAFFVMRKKPMEAVVSGLLERPGTTQRLMIVSGLGGSGKTQLVLRYARDFETSYRHILFVDASSIESLRRGIITRVRAIKRKNGPTTLEEALDVLADPEDVCTKDWMIVMDNADSHTIDLKEYMPMCDHGSILITTRNPELGNLAPSYHLQLDVMDHEEAVEALISSIFPPPPSRSRGFWAQEEVASSIPTTRDHDAAAKIVKELHYLPIAITQAGCYIKQNQCLHDYLDRLKSNRAKLLNRATAVHRDKLKYPHSVYSSFDIILNALSPRAVQLLVVLSFFHFSNFPRPLFLIAAKSGFKHEVFDLLDRDHDFDESVQFLNDILCPGGDWQEDKLDQLLEDLQRYSLVTLVPTNAIVTFRFHPLVRDWARDRLTNEDQKRYQKAAIRLLICGITERDDHRLYEYLVSHTTPFLAAFDTLHVNDGAAILQVLRSEKSTNHVELWETIHGKVKAVYGRMNVRTSRAALMLADAYWGVGDKQKMEEMERDVIAVRELLLGSDHWETLQARSNLGRTLYLKKEYADALAMQTDILRTQIRTVGLVHLQTVQGMQDLAQTLYSLGRYEEARGLHLGVVEIRTRILGRTSYSTINALDTLATYCGYAGRHLEAEALQREVLELKRTIYGNQHIATVNSMRVLASQYHTQGRYKEAEKLRREALEVQRMTHGDLHGHTLDAMSFLARLYFDLRRYEEAEALWKEALAGRKVLNGSQDESTLHVMFWLGRSYFGQQKYTDAEVLWKDHLASKTALNGDQDGNTLTVMFWLGRAYFEQNQYMDAGIPWKEALAGRRALSGDQDGNTLTVMHWLGRACFEQQQYMDAEVLWKEELASRRVLYGDQDEGTLVVMFWLGRSCFELQNYADAEVLWKEELASRRLLHGDQGERILTTMFWLGRSCFELRQYIDAGVLWKEELEFRRGLYGDQDASTLNPMFWLGRSYFELQQYTDAEVLLQHMLAGVRVLKEGQDGSLVAMFWLGRSCFELQKYAEAEVLWREELEFRRGIYGDQDEGTLVVMFWLGRSCFELQKYAEAEVLWKEELEFRRGLYGDQDVSTLDMMSWLGRLYFELKQYMDAEVLWKEELKARRALNGNQDERTLDVMFWLGRSCFELKQYEEAAKLWEEVLSSRRVLCGDQDQSTLDVMFRLGKLCFELKQYEEAAKLWREVLSSRRVLCGDQDQSTLDVMFRLGRSCFELKQYEEAAKLWGEELAARKRNGDTDEQHLTTTAWLVGSYLKLQRYEEAVTSSRELLALRRKVDRDDHRKTLDSMFSLAKSYYELKRYGEAEVLWKEELQIRRAKEDKDSIAQTLYWMSKTYSSQEMYKDAKEAAEEAICIREELYPVDDRRILQVRKLLKSVNKALAKEEIRKVPIPLEAPPTIPPDALPIPAHSLEVPMARETYRPMEREAYSPMGRGTYVPMNRETHVPMDREADVPMDRETYGPMERETYVPMGGEIYVPMDRETYVPMDRGTYRPMERGTYVPFTYRELPAIPQEDLPSQSSSQNSPMVPKPKKRTKLLKFLGK